jgi:hypothetical protein
LSGYLTADYNTTHVTAMMMDSNETFFIDESTNTQRLPIAHHKDEEHKEAEDDDSCDHTRVCGSDTASLTTHPTQAVTAAPGARSVTAGSHPHDRIDSGLSSRKGPDLGGSKVVGVAETVATREKEVPASAPLSRFQQPEFRIKEADSLQRLLNKKETANPNFKSLPVPAPDKLQSMFETWTAQRPDLQFKSPASSGFFDETFGSSIAKPENASGFFDEVLSVVSVVMSPKQI